MTRMFLRLTTISTLLVLITFSCVSHSEEELLKQNPNNCDVSAVSYSQDISKIREDNCWLCHGNVSPSAGLDLSIYQNVSDNSSKIKDRINRPAGDALVMPQTGPMIKCNIDKINSWIDQGALNN